ncbi:unnamed protein product [Porites lobata]|uniref:DDE Tnp4 domain-containing protein n=1 Tax=Porites lobata TaxID=104759 RepID=A0ABN8QLA1_9CNID|nr:unnamed protein product [Porites lobata]
MEEFILNLVRLRLGLLSRHLTDIFGVSEGSVSKVFTTWICFLSTVFRDIFLKWPCKEEIKKKLPSSFNKFPSIRIIIDCTEIFLQKPTSPQRATWSNYKQHNTMKALVGITPTGYFSFVSKLWTGNVSERYITERSGLLDKLEEGDSVMADKGFNIRALLTRKKKLSKKAVKSTRTIASVRIHIERAIGHLHLEDFRILQGNFLLQMLPIADNILSVCAALCNLLPPLAK